MRHGATFLCATVLLSLGLSGCSGSDNSDGGVFDDSGILTVGPSAAADYPSIQAAVTAATSGSTIQIEPGTFTEAVFVGKTLTLVGSGAATIVEFPAAGQPDSAVIEIRDVGGVRLEALSVRSSPASVDGIRVRNATAIVIQSVIASNNSGDGVDIRRSRGVEVIDGVFESNGGDGLQVDEASTNVTVTGCHAASNLQDGFKVRSSLDVTLDGNESTTNVDEGILVRSCRGVHLVGNTSTFNSSWGIRVIDSADTTFDQNVSENNGSGDLRCEPLPCSVR